MQREMKIKEFEKEMRDRGYVKVEITDYEGNVYKGFCSKVDVRRYNDSSKSNVVIDLKFFNKNDVKIKDDDIFMLNLRN